MALKFATKAQALPPGPGPWLLKLDTQAAAGSEEPHSALHLDAANGKVLSADAVEQQYPAVAGLTMEEWRERSVLATWQGLVRLAMQAHQRRGESDAVAHWMYVALALDPGAPEWKHVLAGPEL